MSATCPQCGASLPAHGLDVREVGIVLAPPDHERNGLLAWAQAKVGALLLAGLAVRRSVDGDLTVTFPARKDKGGSLHRLVTPLDRDLDGRIRAAVIAAYVEVRGKAGRRPS